MATLPAQDLSVDLRAVTVRPTWGAQEHRRWDRLVAEHHYLPFHGVIGKGLRHVAVHGETWLALIGWQPGAFKLAARDRWIGWPAEQQFRCLHLIANNSRFVILTPGRVRNLASRVLGLSLRRLSQDIQAVHGYPVFLAETFVDVSRFVGTCYELALSPLWGIPEDPATGAAATALGGYLALRDPRGDARLSWTVEQGFAMGRPSIIEVEADKRGGQVTEIRVGGASVMVSEGDFDVP